MTAEEKAKYSREGLPKIKNVFTYSFNVLLKIVFLIYFGVGAIVLAVVVFPFLRLFSIGKDFGIMLIDLL